MEHHISFNPPSSDQGADFGEGRPATGPERAQWGAYPLVDGLPRMFALVQEFDGDEGGDTAGETVEVVAYGLVLPGGTATTVGANGWGFGLWNSARSAARRLHSDLVWLGQDSVRPDAAQPGVEEFPLRGGQGTM